MVSGCVGVLGCRSGWLVAVGVRGLMKSWGYLLCTMHCGCTHNRLLVSLAYPNNP